MLIVLNINIYNLKIKRQTPLCDHHIHVCKCTYTFVRKVLMGDSYCVIQCTSLTSNKKKFPTDKYSIK